MKVFRDIIRRNDLDEKWRAFATRFNQEV
jgi:hypothetical protein